MTLKCDVITNADFFSCCTITDKDVTLKLSEHADRYQLHNVYSGIVITLEFIAAFLRKAKFGKLR